MLDILSELNPHQEERQKAIIGAGVRPVKVIEDVNENYFAINAYKNSLFQD